MTQVIYENRRWWRRQGLAGREGQHVDTLIIPRTHQKHRGHIGILDNRQVRYNCAQDGCYLCKVLIAEHAEAAQERWERQCRENEQIVKEWREARAHLKSVQARVDYVSRVVASDPNPERREVSDRTWSKGDVEPHTWTRIEGYLNGPQLPENENPPWSKRTKKKKGKKNVR